MAGGGLGRVGSGAGGGGGWVVGGAAGGGAGGWCAGGCRLAGVQRGEERGPLFAAGTDRSAECEESTGGLDVRYGREGRDSDQPAGGGAHFVCVYAFAEGDCAGCGDGEIDLEIRLGGGWDAAGAGIGLLDGRQGTASAGGGDELSVRAGCGDGEADCDFWRGWADRFAEGAADGAGGGRV